MSMRFIVIAALCSCQPADVVVPPDTGCEVEVRRIEESVVTAWRVPVSVTQVKIPLYAQFATQLVCWLIPDDDDTTEVFRRVVSGFDDVSVSVNGGGAVIQCHGDDLFVEFFAPEISCGVELAAVVRWRHVEETHTPTATK